MRDQYDAQIWNDHHHQFSEWVGSVGAAARASLRRGASLAAALPAQLIAVLVAVSLTLVTFGAAAVA